MQNKQRFATCKMGTLLSCKIATLLTWNLQDSNIAKLQLAR